MELREGSGKKGRGNRRLEGRKKDEDRTSNEDPAYTGPQGSLKKCEL